jgi:DNA-binding NarL/FixJ family response regulator
MHQAGAPISILIVDDHPLVREGIASLVGNCPDLRLVAEAADGRAALEQFRRCRPDITLMDLRMPGPSGIDALCSIRAEFPQARVIILTTYDGDVLMQRALRAGASGYLLKSAVRTDLIDVIRAVHAGQRRIQPEMALKVAPFVAEGLLSDREVKVLGLIAEGNSNKHIARLLEITEGTVKTHVKNILSKLRANDRTHAATLGMERGIIGF